MGLTRKRDLRDGEAVWTRYALPKVTGSRLRRSLRTEVVVVGSFGGSPNGMPTIGPIPGYPKCYAVMGYGGNGITFSMLSTKLITAAILGRVLPEARLFAFK
jgi:glycine/D-amino acid oxidase-like deaminating enzyme